MEEVPSPTSPPISEFSHSASLSSMSTNSSLLDIPSTIYMLEEGSVKSSVASFTTTGRSETRSDAPIAYEDLYRDTPNINRIFSSPTMILRARSKSLGMIPSQRSDSIVSTSDVSPLSGSPRPSSVSSLSSNSQREFLDSPAPAYEESIAATASVRHNSVSESFDHDHEEDNDYLPPPRHPIQRRPEEGNEELPEYSCTVFRTAVVNRKQECVYPGLPAKKREWTKIYALLLGTVLRIYSLHSDGTLPVNFSLDHPHREYTLQYAEAGIASDYVKKKFVLRVRAEGEQFLMQCSSEDERDAWVESIQAGSSIALALEDRNMPRYITLPRRRRGRYAAVNVSRSRPVVQRIQPRGVPAPQLQTVQSAPPVLNSPQSTTRPHRTASSVTVNSDRSASPSCTSDNPLDTDLDAATVLALCLDGGRSHPTPRERILISMLTARQPRQNEWVIINGRRRKISPRSGELEEPLELGEDPMEDEHRARLLKSRRSFGSRLFKIFWSWVCTENLCRCTKYMWWMDTNYYTCK